MKIYSFVSSALIIIFLSSCSTLEKKVIPSKYLLRSDYLTIYSPNSHGWGIVKNTRSQTAFAKKLPGEYATLAAEVIIFQISKPIENEQDFFEYVKKLPLFNNTNRYKIISRKYDLYKKRSYPCVKEESLIQDKKAKINSSQTKELIMEIKSIICQDSKLKNVGFKIGYSHRGDFPYENFEEEAMQFIEQIELARLNN